LKRFLASSYIFAGLTIGYLALPASVRERLTELFALEYEIPVKVVKARKGAVDHPLTAQGEFEPLKEIRINATVPGVVKEIRFAPGDRVAAGTVVATIETAALAERLDTQESTVKEAEATVKESQSQLAVAEKQLATKRALYQKNYIAGRELVLAEAAAKTARAQRDAAEAQLAQRLSLSAQTRHVLGLARISAPVAGIVTRRWVEPGAMVSEAVPILSIAQAETMKLWINLKSADAEGIKPGMAAQVKVDAFPQRNFRGKVTQVQEAANFSGDEWSVEIETPNPGGALKFGMPASVSLASGERRDGIFVPRTVLFELQGESCLYVMERGKARQRNVALGKKYDDKIEVLSGVKPGEDVIVSGTEHLRDGSRVRVVE
jgi:RND family efflux transporter MFP subunit